jgi:hypothetical protein
MGLDGMGWDEWNVQIGFTLVNFFVPIYALGKPVPSAYLLLDGMVCIEGMHVLIGHPNSNRF